MSAITTTKMAATSNNVSDVSLPSAQILPGAHWQTIVGVPVALLHSAT